MSYRSPAEREYALDMLLERQAHINDQYININQCPHDNNSYSPVEDF